ncbi:hypothetical protein EDD22DRAFT_852144 [Suillus occidentalis]|nr:hypothetical protein EDD22DRAFT_852144 [Suillus occidentalis]
MTTLLMTEQWSLTSCHLFYHLLPRQKNQESGTRDECLSCVIQSKYEVGLLKPYDDCLSTIKAANSATVAVAQSLCDIDLVFMEEAFERVRYMKETASFNSWVSMDKNKGDDIMCYDEYNRTGMKGTLSCIMTNTSTANTNVVHRHLTSHQVMDTFKCLSIQAPKHRPQPLPNPNLHTSSPSSPFTVSLPRLVASPSRVVDISIYYLSSTISESKWDQMLSIVTASTTCHVPTIGLDTINPLDMTSQHNSSIEAWLCTTKGLVFALT